MSDYLDEDGEQEYALALLEGCGHEQALKRGRSANNAVSSKRQLARAVLSHWVPESDDGDLEEVWDTGYSYMQDSRSDEERERAWAAGDLVASFLEICTEHQRRVLDLRFGLTSGEPMSNRQVAKVLGIAPQSVDKAMAHIRKKAERVTQVTQKEVAFS